MLEDAGSGFNGNNYLANQVDDRTDEFIRMKQSEIAAMISDDQEDEQQ